MKKILTLFVIMTLTTSASLASSFGRALKNAIKQDINNAKTEAKTTNNSIKKSIKSDYRAAKQEAKNIKNDIKNQYKTDVNNYKKAQNEAEAKRKKETLNEIESKLADLNKEMTTVKNAKNITETERTIRTRFIQRQINYYNKQKAYLLK